MVADQASVTFSIVIPTYRSRSKLETTLTSVLEQDFPTIECLVVDGDSRDGTLELLRTYAERVRFVCEPDEGIYDAMNKGVSCTTGRFVYFLGAGDRLRPGILQAVVDEVAKLPSLDETLRRRPTLLYGDVYWPKYRRPYDGRFNRFTILRRNICQQAIFYERLLFDQLGPFQTKYRLLADWVFNIRCFTSPNVKTCYVPLVIADYEGDGLSHTVTDLPFYLDRAMLIRRQYGLPLALLLHAKFLLTHPRALLSEPWRRLRHLLWPSARSPE